MNKNSIPDIVIEIISELGDGKYIFRGTPQAFSEHGKDKINSSLYRWMTIKNSKSPSIRAIFKKEKENVTRAKKYFSDKTSDREILTDLQHYGNPTNLIDFSTNIYVALFFACNKDINQAGELLFLDTEEIGEREVIDYTTEELIREDFGNERSADSQKNKIFSIPSATKESSQQRVIAQSSIFVYSKCGYIEKTIPTIYKIPAASKQPILDHLERMINIAPDAIYNDLFGFIANQTIIYPDSSTAPEPNEHMPADIKKIYEEARSISGKSPRATAALLRLAVEKLCDTLSGKKGALNEQIKDLVANGLPKSIQEALDTVRVIGNESVWHGQIDLSGKDGKEIVGVLFDIVNFIVETMIAEPREIPENFKKLPENQREAIDKQDRK